MRIIFVGTSSFGVPVLEKLIALKENIITVITQPDRPGGRGKKIQASPIKESAIKYGIDLFQPENINNPETLHKIRSLHPDLIILISYGQILSKAILDIPTVGCLNIHPSLLPKYKGPAPIQWTLIKGETETGISFLFMNEKIDAGDLIYQEKIKILPGENYQELSKRLAARSALLIKEILEKIAKGKIEKIPQSQEKYFYARKLNKTDCRINWHQNGTDIFHFIRGVTDTPGAYTEFKGKRIKITEASLLTKKETGFELAKRQPGDILKVDKEGIYVLTGDGSQLVIKRLILSGCKEMNVCQFINGYSIKKGDSLI